jgi:hypothetical protein
VDHHAETVEYNIDQGSKGSINNLCGAFSILLVFSEVFLTVTDSRVYKQKIMLLFNDRSQFP